MIDETNVKARNQASELLLADKVSNNAIDPPTTPLARVHSSQKHAYSLDKYDHSGAAQLYVDNQQASLAVEAAVAIVINGIHYAVLMASPNQLEYLAVGFLFSEGLIQHSHELLDWEVTPLVDVSSYQQFAQDLDDTNDKLATVEQISKQLQDYDVYVVELVLSQRCHQRIQAQRRQLAGRTGCGMCGITGLTQALPDLSSYLQNGLSHEHDSHLNQKAAIPSLDYLLDMRQKVDALQHTHQLTGAVHAAATIHEQQLYLFEDVGRHNALDKLIGWQLRQKIDVDCVLMTSRLSIELVQKSVRGRIPWLVGMSAPTSTAIRVAERYGLGVAGFLRNDRVTYYSGYKDF